MAKRLKRYEGNAHNADEREIKAKWRAKNGDERDDAFRFVSGNWYIW